MPGGIVGDGVRLVVRTGNCPDWGSIVFHGINVAFFILHHMVESLAETTRRQNRPEGDKDENCGCSSYKQKGIDNMSSPCCLLKREAGFEPVTLSLEG